MKFALVCVVVFTIPFTSYAQDFDKYNDMEQVDRMVISKSMLEMMSQLELEDDSSDMKQLMELISNLDDIKILSTSDEQIAQDMKSDVHSYVSSSELEEFMSTTEDKRTLNFYSKPGSSADKISQLFMVLEDEQQSGQFVMLSITGDIDPENLSYLAESLRGMPGAEALGDLEL